MRAVGANIGAARFAGMPVTAVLVKTALLSGGLAALAGWSEVAGLKGHLSLDLSPGFGYTGIIVAMLALLHPLGVVVFLSPLHQFLLHKLLQYKVELHLTLHL
jgi:simple sugar transport system permease protein